jgi:7-cyano-7-deazaguanine synthase
MARGAAVVLLSGGMDSATTLALAVRDGFETHALTVAYGQRHGVEIERARELAKALGVASHRVVEVDLSVPGGSSLTDTTLAVPRSRSDDDIASGMPSTYVPARNTVLLSLALSWAEALGAQDLFIGVNAVDYSGYPDCRPAFLEAFESLARVSTRAGVEGRGVRVHAPLLKLSKAEIVRRAVELGVDLSRTVSCYDPSPEGTACGQCDACRLRARGFKEAGLKDPAERSESQDAGDCP